MEAKFGPIEKGIKRLTSIEKKVFRTDGYKLFDRKKNEEIL